MRQGNAAGLVSVILTAQNFALPLICASTRTPARIDFARPRRGGGSPRRGVVSGSFSSRPAGACGLRRHLCISLHASDIVHLALHRATPTKICPTGP